VTEVVTVAVAVVVAMKEEGFVEALHYFLLVVPVADVPSAAAAAA
jgi:hypothetical protein